MQAHLLLTHGGNCCGVTHLYLGQTGRPSSQTDARLKKFDATSGESIAETGVARGVYVEGLYRSLPAPPAYSEYRPAETYGERVHALLEGFLARANAFYPTASGVIEAVTTDRQSEWEPWLEEHGFTRCVSARNSNSRKLLTVWLLPYGTDAKVHPQEKGKSDVEG